MNRKRVKKALEAQVSLTFEYYELLNSIARDMERIAAIIPAETSRYGCLFTEEDGDAAVVIEARKSDLLRYLQSACEDHALFSWRLLDKGWTADGTTRAKEAK